MKKIIIFVILALAASTTVKSQTNADRTAYKSGERLEFAVSYRAAMWPNTDMGKVTFTVSDDNISGRSTHKVAVNAKTSTFFAWFFKMDDKYNTWIDKETLRPLKATSDLSEGSYRFTSTYDFDWSERIVNTRYRNLKKPKESTRTMRLTDGSMDAISLFYNLRSEDIHSYKVGEARVIELVLEDTIRKIQYRYLGSEKKNVSGLGEVKTLKFSCQIATSEGERFEDGSEFFLWVTDDRNKVPVLLESPIKIGSVRARLISYKNLKYPKDSVLK